MKNTLKLAAIALVAVFVYACSGGSSPEKNAKEYLDAMNAEDFDKAKEFCTKETGGMLDMMKSLTASMGSKKDTSKTEVEIKDLKCVISGDTTAVCTYCCTKEGQPGELKMKKEGDKWLAHQPKENPMGGDESGGEIPLSDTSAVMPSADTSMSAPAYK